MQAALALGFAMYILFLLVHLLVAFLLGVVVLLQRSKGNGLAGAFGGVGAGEAMFGAQGVTTFLHKATIWLAVGFFVTSLTLAVLSASRSANDGNIGRRVQDALPMTTSGTPVPTTTDAPLPMESGEGGDGVVPSTDDTVPVPDTTGGEDETGTGGEGTGGGEESNQGGN